MSILKAIKTFINIVFNPVRIFLINIRRNILREIFIGIGILIASFSIIIALTFGRGVDKMSSKNMFSKVPATRIKIQGRIYSNPLNAFLNRRVHSQVNLSWPFIKKHILSIKGVKGVVPIQKVTYPMSAEIPLPTNVMRLDVIANGLPTGMAYRYMFPYYRRQFNWRFEKKGDLIPVLVSKFIIDAFMQVAVSSDTPLVINRSLFTPSAANGFRGFRFKLNVGYSIFGKVLSGHREYEAVVVGFTDPDITAGISLPASFVRQTKIEFQGPYIGNTFESAFIFIKDATYFDSVVKSLDALKRKYPAGFNIMLDTQVQRFREVSKMINKAGKAIRIPILGFSVIVLFLSCMIVYFAFLYLIKRREKEIGLFRFFGSSRIKIVLLLVFEAVFVSIICVYAGILISKYVLIKYIPDNFSAFFKALPKDLKVILSLVSLNSKQAFISFFGFDKVFSYKIGLYVVAASAVSAFIPSLIGSYKGILKSVNK